MGEGAQVEPAHWERTVGTARQEPVTLGCPSAEPTGLSASPALCVASGALAMSSFCRKHMVCSVHLSPAMWSEGLICVMLGKSGLCCATEGGRGVSADSRLRTKPGLAHEGTQLGQHSAARRLSSASSSSAQSPEVELPPHCGWNPRGPVRLPPTASCPYSLDVPKAGNGRLATPEGKRPRDSRGTFPWTESTPQLATV